MEDRSPQLPSLWRPFAEWVKAEIERAFQQRNIGSRYVDAGSVRGTLPPAAVKPHDILSPDHTDSDDADVPAEGDVLTYRTDRWVSEAMASGGTTLDTANTANPPTEAQAESIFSAPATWGRKLGHLDDQGAHASEYLALSDGTAFWLTTLAMTRGSATVASATNAATYLTTPTYDTSGQACHPAVYDAGAGQTWNGHRYWMAMTPYPSENDSLENPSLLVSEDGANWTVPSGLTNPIATPSAGCHLCDPEILVDQSGVMWLYYVEADYSTFCKFYVRSSSDGTSWSAATLLFTTGFACESPAVLFDGSGYVMWHNDSTASPYTLKRRTCSTPNGSWTSPTTCTVSGLPSGYSTWHVDVVKRGAEYHAFLVLEESSGWPNTRLYFATSSDGLAWTIRGLLLDTTMGWDSINIYRASGVPTSTGYDLWYSARGASSTWHIGRTAVTLDYTQSIANLSRLIAIRATQAMVESFAGDLEEMALGYATDLDCLGVYAGGDWHWLRGVTDHGLLSGLGDDDHPQYLLASAATNRATFAAGWAELVGGGSTTLHSHAGIGVGSAWSVLTDGSSAAVVDAAGDWIMCETLR